MSGAIVDRVWKAGSIRMVGDGISAGDLFAAQREVTRWEQWYPFWAKRGDEYEALAREAVARGRRLSAGELLWQASMAYHYAQFVWFHDPPTRDAGQRKKVELYREAAPLFDPPAERFDLPFDGFTIPGYLRVPRGGAGRAPVVVLLGGLESTKEESYLFENQCLRRGMATCAFDGPGQGEMYFQVKLRGDFNRFTSAVVDWLAKRPELDVGRLGVLGRSLGGFYAVQSAAHDPRFKACVAWGVLYDLSYYDDMHEPTKSGFAFVAGYDDARKAAPYLKRTINLSGQAERVSGAVYALHGGQDDLIPPTQVDRLREALRQNRDVTFDMPKDGDHCCHNLYHVVRPRMADWLAERLDGHA